jgi:plasmid maintenance system antidote protein VapI
MPFDYSKLRGRIIEKFGSVSAFADAYGISLNSMSRKLNGKMAITTDDIVKMSKPEFLDIPTNEIHEYFFVYKVQAS